MKGIVPSRVFSFKPHLPFRFAVQFITGETPTDETLARYQYTVKSCKVSQMSGDTAAAAIHGGDGYYTIPIFDTASRTLEIEFEETDDMRIMNFLDDIIVKQRFGLPFVVGIVVHQFDYKMKDPISSRLYSCILEEYDEPSFARTGSPNLVTAAAKFIIMAEQTWNGVDSVQGLFGQQIAVKAEDISDLTGLAAKFKEESKGMVIDDKLKAQAEEWKKKTQEEIAKEAQQSTQNAAPADATAVVNNIVSAVESEKLSNKKIEFKGQFISAAAYQDLKNMAERANMDIEKGTYIFFDIESNRQYFVENGKIVHDIAAITATGDADQSNGETQEGIYVLSDLNAGGKHGNRDKAVANAIKSQLNLQSDAEIEEIYTKAQKLVASGVAKTHTEALKSLGVDLSNVTYQENGTTKKLTNGRAAHMSTNTISRLNKTDYSGNNFTKIRDDTVGVHTHIITNSNLASQIGEMSGEKSIALRSVAKDKQETLGCIVKSEQDQAYEALFIKKHNGKVNMIVAGGTSTSNRKNNTNDLYS